MPANFGLAPTLGKTDRRGFPEVHQGGNGEDELPPGITWRAADATELGTVRLSPRGRAANPPPRVSGPRGAPLLPGDGRSQSGVSVPTGFALSKTRQPPPYPPSRGRGAPPGTTSHAGTVQRLPLPDSGGAARPRRPDVPPPPIQMCSPTTAGEEPAGRTVKEEQLHSPFPWAGGKAGVACSRQAAPEQRSGRQGGAESSHPRNTWHQAWKL